MNASESPPRRRRSRRTKSMVVAVVLAVTGSLVYATTSQGRPSGTEGTVPLGTVVPQPVKVSTDEGVAFDLEADDAIYASQGSASAKAAAEFLAGLLRKPTGYALPVRSLSPGDDPEGIVLSLGGKNAVTKKEGYQLDIDSGSVRIRADDRGGLFNGVATLRQLLPVKVERQQKMAGPWRVQGGRISDAPRYGYRGAMLDVGRHFMPVKNVKKYIDTIARYKVNNLHLHLTDDQGWRIAVKSWPKLTEIGGKTGVGGMLGGYFTQADYKDIVQYAAARGITVIPEIDGPNHAHAALASYAELNCDGKALEPYTGFAQSPDGNLCVDKDITYKFLDDVIGELADLTPGPYIAIGGDETQNRSKAEMDTYFGKVNKIVKKHGKKPYGWMESAGSMPKKGSLSEYWAPGISDDELIAAGKAGGKVVLAPSSKAYLDMKYTEDYPEYPVGQTWGGTVTVEQSYDWNPDTHLKGLPAKAVAGVEAPMFTETLFGIHQVEDLAFPRMLAIAEIGWAKESSHDWKTFAPRLAAQGPRLREARVNYYLDPGVPWPMGS
ncbi:beta-N-acetylhexosaminidase [Streptomyces albus]|uniref:beta-N-acetylhexosaminidase n=1 Tax=Streptomyces albus TaxID=1888 RepID=UPI0006E2A386|nr:beta-N-acetylhexosaminidase [Streptomyces albus]